jgi:Zn finger protein HypA/HybF involved in hydrogenase expression
MDKVERGRNIYTYGYGVGRSGAGFFTGRSYRDGKWGDFNRRHWGDHYDSHAWQQYHRVGSKPPTHAVIPETTKEPPNLQLPLDDQEEIIPCFTCKYREEKLLLEEDDSLDDELYKCEKCNLVISSESDELTCPNCKTDNHLELIEEKDLTDKFEEIPDQQIKECPHCSMTLSPDENHYVCPYCFRSLAEYEYDKEKEIQLQQFIDSGLLLDPESEEANTEALKQLGASGVDKIPDPDKDVIPISTKQPEEKWEPAWKTALKKVFKGSNV